jgi:putative thioredoxin
MMTSDYIIDVNEADFDFEVIKYSQNVPVLVDFWADWCKPCKALSPMLERLANEAGGAFRLAKVDTDANPNLAMLYSVRSIPTVKAFSGGQVVAEFVGLQPEERLREFLGKIAQPGPAALTLEKAESLLSLNEWTLAEVTFRQVTETNPDHPAALLGLSKSLLAQARTRDALTILRNFPPSKQYNQVLLLQPYADALLEYEDNSLPEETDLDAAFHSAIRLASRGKFAPALDGLLDILRQEKGYRQGRARQVAVALLELLGEENPLTRPYRAELASILF